MYVGVFLKNENLKFEFWARLKFWFIIILVILVFSPRHCKITRILIKEPRHYKTMTETKEYN
jgi:hypothetical protein